MGLSLEGWRKSAAINIITVSMVTVLCCVLLGISSGRAGGINANFIFYQGNCETSSKINIWLHLLVNTVSAGVLASSTFFRQLICSPTRAEVDAAHAKNTPMEIGVLSISNLFYMSPFKMLIWLLFFLTSIPIHVFFNSIIISTSYEGGNWRLTMASEAFTDGAQYYPPGAFLWAAGGFEYLQGYGDPVNTSEYFEPQSDEVRNISWTAQSASSWKRIEVPECVSQYVYCSARTEYRDVVMIVRSHEPSYSFSPNSSLGWSRDSVLAPLSDAEAAYWDPHVPATQSDSLWFSANCSTTAVLDPRLYRATGCSQSCYSACGQPTVIVEANSPNGIATNYTFDFLYNDLYTAEEQAAYWPGTKDHNASILDLEYCLVQEMQPLCKVGLVNVALLIVIVCLLIKMALSMVVFSTFRRSDLLIVLGDAIAAFITQPDVATKGRCTLDRSGIQVKDKEGPFKQPKPRPWHQKNRRWFAAIPKARWVCSYLFFAALLSFAGGMFASAQKWEPVSNGSQSFGHNLSNGLLTPQGQLVAQLLSTILLANLPQLLLSFSYLVYNALYTRLCTEMEWNSYCRNFRPLRVTSPMGQQVSTYRLQLPYRYSISLIVSSILLHWLISNAIYVFILEGGYYQVDTTLHLLTNTTVPSSPGSGISNDAFVGIGFSTIALLAVIVVGCVLAIVPLVLCSWRMKHDMVLGSTNSMVISAACHAVPALGTRSPTRLSMREDGDGYSPLPPSEPMLDISPSSFPSMRRAEHNYSPVLPCEPTPSRHETPHCQDRLEAAQGDFEMQNLLGVTSTHHDVKSEDGETEDLKEALIRVSQVPLRWGVVKMPTAHYQQHTFLERPVGHLAFGAAEHDVGDPVEGHWYA